MSDIVERLRNNAMYPEDSRNAAADEIDRLRAEVASLKEERDELDEFKSAALVGLNVAECRISVLEEQADQLTQQLAAANGRVEMLRDALGELRNYAIRFVCYHDETHRGGAIWEICDQCGQMWADDEGGKPKEFKEPEAIRKANTALSNLNKDRAKSDV
jgi:hypothetical protein